MASRLQRLRRTPVSETFPFAGPAFRRAAPWLLAVALFLGLLTRLHPAMRYAVWGSDSGEYHMLTGQLVETGRIVLDYDGWGIAYPYFPGMFVVSGAVTAVLGLDLFYAVQLTVPVLASLIPVFIGLFAYRVTSDPRAGMVAAVFTAVTAPVVIVTSHAMPGTLGELLLVGILALIPDAYRARRYWALLAPLSVALVLTHHLTTYFAVGIVAFGALLREISSRRSDPQRLRLEVPLAGLLLLGACVWWLGVATPFREEIVGDALGLPPVVTALGFLLALAALPLAVLVKRRTTRWIARPRYPDFATQARTIAGIFFGIAGIVALIVLTRVPGTNIEVSWAALFYVVPVLGFIAFLPLGMGAIRFNRQGTLAVGWLYAVLASLVFSIITANKVLFPFRHVDYMVMAMAPPLAVGMLMVYDQTIAAKIPAERAQARGLLIAGLVALVLVSTVFSLPPRETIGGFEEGMTGAEVAGVRWAAENLEPGTAIAADHRISSLLWGYGQLHATWDEGRVTYHSETTAEALDDLREMRTPPSGIRRIDYVFLSPPIEEGVTLVQWETSAPMSPAAIAKFEDPCCFEKVYDDDGVRIYRVKWEAEAVPFPTP